MVLTVFRSRLREDNRQVFQALADDMMELAKSMPGFRSYKVFVAEDGERASLVEFDSAEQLRAWREHPRHAEAQRIGRERYYEEYTLLACQPVRESRFRRE